MNEDCTHLDWKPVLLLKVIRYPFSEANIGLSVRRLYLAAHPDGILGADWTLPADERFLPLVHFVGWKPERDVPFVLPTQYRRGLTPAGISLIPSGAWVLDYHDGHYQLYERMRMTIHSILEQVEKAPTDPQTLRMLTRWTT
ncbi:MAG: hypothetical protein SF029_01675 [bacterium]|nr:hypothetical protein [bacterium]